MDYGMPRADTMPNVEAELEEVPCKTNPLGVKGIGESGTIGAPPTVINALIDALAPLGVDRIDMPATPLRVWQAISRARSGAAAHDRRSCPLPSGERTLCAWIKIQPRFQTFTACMPKRITTRVHLGNTTEGDIFANI
jgi:hypothetical protein